MFYLATISDQLACLLAHHTDAGAAQQLLLPMMSTMKIFRARDTVNDLRPGEGAVLAENGKVCRSKCLVVGDGGLVVLSILGVKA